MIQRIVSQEEHEKKRRRNQLILGGILIVVMFLSVLGYGFSDSNPGSTTDPLKVPYNGRDFVFQNGFWQLQLGDFQFSFTNHPNQVPSIPGDVNPLSAYSGKVLYISSEDIQAEFELDRVFNSVILRKQYACLEGTSCTQDYPIKNCSENIIILNEDEITNISQQNNCVFISAPAENITAVVDEFLFKTIGVK